MEYMSETAAPKEENDWVTVMVLGALFCHLQSTVVVVFALNRSFYPTSAVHPVSVLIHPRRDANSVVIVRQKIKVAKESR